MLYLKFNYIYIRYWFHIITLFVFYMNLYLLGFNPVVVYLYCLLCQSFGGLDLAYKQYLLEFTRPKAIKVTWFNQTHWGV